MLGPGELAPVNDDEQPAGRYGRRLRRRRGYRSVAERFVKTRSLAILRARLTSAQQALDAGRPSIAVGGKRLWRNRNHLDTAEMTEQQWRDRWTSGTPVFRPRMGSRVRLAVTKPSALTKHGRLRIKTPAALISTRTGIHIW